MANNLFPLSADYFPPLHLTNEESEAFLSWGDQLLQQTLDAYERYSRESEETRERKWKLLKQKNQLTVYRQRKGEEEDDYKYITTGFVDGSLDEVIVGRYADTTDDFRRINAVYREDLVDCAVLHVIEHRSPLNAFAFAGFKWMTMTPAAKGLVSRRDVCCFEKTGLTRDHNGKEIGYTLTESVDIPTCPPFHNVYRAKISVCYLYKQNKRGGVKVFMRGKNEAGGNAPEWITDIKCAELWFRIDNSMNCTHAVVATALVRASMATTRRRNARGKCDICHEKSSSMLSSEKMCGVCHRTTCSKCIVKKRVLSSQADFRQTEKANFCKKCVLLIHEVNLRDPQSVHDICMYAAASSSDTQSQYSGGYQPSECGTTMSTDTNDLLTRNNGIMGPELRSKAESVSSGGSSSHRSHRHHSNARPPPPIPASAVLHSDINVLPPYGADQMPQLERKVSRGMEMYPRSNRTPSSGSVRSGGGNGNMAMVPSSAASNASKRRHYYSNHKMSGQHASFSSDRSMTVSTASGGSRDDDESFTDLSSIRGPLDRHMITKPQSRPDAYGYEPPRSNRAANYDTTDGMMQQMIKMNIMAEQAQRQLIDNERAAKQMHNGYPEY